MPQFLVPSHEMAKALELDLTQLYSVSFNVPLSLVAGARDLISRLLKKDPSSRLPLAEVMKHEWVLRMVDIENKKRMKQ